jgi:hypothetical protein
LVISKGEDHQNTAPFFEKFVNKEHFENAVQMFGEKPHPLLGGADVRDWIL